MCKEDVLTMEMVEISLKKKIGKFLIKVDNLKTINYYSDFYHFLVIKEYNAPQKLDQ